MKIFQSVAEICSIPKSPAGRTAFLLAFAGAVSALVFVGWNALSGAAEVLWEGSHFEFESQAAAAAHALRSVSKVFISLFVSSILAFGVLAGNWLLVYIIYRAFRNAEMGARQYLRVWIFALAIMFVAPVLYSAIALFGSGTPQGLLLSAVLNLPLFLFFKKIADYSFGENPPRCGDSWRSELTKRELVAITKRAVREKFPHFKRWILVAAFLLSLVAIVAGA